MLDTHVCRDEPLCFRQRLQRAQQVHADHVAQHRLWPGSVGQACVHGTARTLGSKNRSRVSGSGAAEVDAGKPLAAVTSLSGRLRLAVTFLMKRYVREQLHVDSLAAKERRMAEEWSGVVPKT